MAGVGENNSEGKTKKVLQKEFKKLAANDFRWFRSVINIT
jgi:hypothetical protein